MGVHTTLHVLTKNDLWEISEDEAHSLAEAAAKVQAEYGLLLTPKQEAWVELIGALGTVYGSRIGSAMMLKASAKAAAQRKAMASAPASDDFVAQTENAVVPSTPIQPVAPVTARAGFAAAPGATHPHQIFPRGHGGAQN
jgi:pyruvate/2-oxoglutarate dehydrogenase complex dihydrolipoamide acyltransferase (E2) component